MHIRYAAGMLVMMVAGAGCVPAQDACLLRDGNAGAVRVGMTAGQARQALRGSTITQSEDRDRIPILVVTRDGARVMDLYPDIDDPRPERTKIELVRVYDPKCSTPEGLRPGMPLAEAEKRYGKMLRIEKTETESSELAKFEKLSGWLEVQAGVAAKVQSLWISHDRGAAAKPAK